MQRITDLLVVIFNMIFIFATVSYVASSVADAVSNILGWRAKLLFQNIKSMVDDPQFDGLARALYNNLLFSPLGKGDVESENDLRDSGTLPPAVHPSIFGQAIVQVLGLERIAREVLDLNLTLDDFKSRAKEHLVESKASIRTPDARTDGWVTIPISARMRELALDLVIRNSKNATARGAGDDTTQIDTALVMMIQEIANWFAYSQVFATQDYKKRTRWVTAGAGFLIAAGLDLQPLPLGGGTLAGKIQYGVSVLEWALVGLSTLFGAAFWFQIAQSFSLAGVKTMTPQAGLAGQAVKDIGSSDTSLAPAP